LDEPKRLKLNGYV